MSGAIRKMGKYDTVREAAGSPVPTPPQAGVPAPVLSALQSRSSSWLLSQLPYRGQWDHKAHTGSGKAFPTLFCSVCNPVFFQQ